MEYDTSRIHELLDEAERQFTELFAGEHDGPARSHIERVTPHLNTVRNIIDLAAQEAAKEA